MSKLSILLLSFVISSVGLAQPATYFRVSVPFTSGKNKIDDAATAELKRGNDSAILKTTLSEAGMISFDEVSPGTYYISISQVGFQRITTPLFKVSNSDVTLAPVKMETAVVGELQNVTVTAKKPFIQKLTDRIVVNVAGNIVSAGSSAIEVLEQAPGVTIDQNDIISLRGRSGVIIYIDGRRSALSGADLANYLRGLPSSAIDHIDIITIPSAKYEAAGNSGIIDIIMKKDQGLGSNGTLTAGYGQGVYPKANAGGTFNYRNKKLNIFGNYNYNYRVNLNNLILDRNFFTNGEFVGQDKKDNYSKMPTASNSLRLGTDFFINKNTTLGFVVNSSFNHFRRKNNNSSIVIDKAKLPSFRFNTGSTNNDHANNTVANINLRHTFDTTGRQITADVDYGVFNNNSLSTIATKYYNLDGNTRQPDYVLKGDQDGRLSLLSGKIDYSHPLKNEAKLEAGMKASHVESDNDARFFDISNGTSIKDSTKTNHFLYEEGNYAGYINFNRQFKKFNLQAGLRGEQTQIKTRQLNGNVQFDSGYFQLFPSAFFNYKLKEDQTIGLSVSRRIDRPGYNALNPFLFLIDVTTYSTGRPALLPQFTWAYELSYGIKNLNFSLSYSHTKNVQNIAILRFSDAFPNIILPDSNITVQVPVNLNSSDYFGLSVSAPVRVSKWWNMMNNADIYYNSFNGNLAGTALNNGTPAADIRINNTFTFKKGLTAELNGNYNSGGRYGYMVSKSRWGIAAGIQKSVLNNKGTIRLNMTDIFWTNLPRATITYNNYIEYWHAYRESRVANISFSYKFGNNKVAAAKRRATASDEELRRAGAN